MALSQKHRSSIYRTLVPLLGEEEAEALMHEFPVTERDELVTRSMLLATEATLRQEITELRADVAEHFTQLGDRFHRQAAWLATIVVAAVSAAAAFG